MIIKGEIRGIQNFVLCYIDSENNVKSFLEILRDIDLAMTLPNVVVSSKEGVQVPFLVETEGKDFTKILTFFEKVNAPTISEEQRVAYFENLVNLTKAYNVEVYSKMNEVYKQALSYLDGEILTKVDLPITKMDNSPLTKTLVNQLNAKSNKGMEIENNETKFRENPDSELFLVVPNAEALSIADPDNFIPQLASVFVPYKHDELNTLKYKNYLGAEGITIDYVDGSPDNVTNEIFPEEQRYYDSLCILHRALLDLKYPGKLKECEEMKTSSEHFRKYITQLITRVLTYHWNQHGLLPLGVSEDDDEGDDDDSNDDENRAPRESLMGNKLFQNGIDFIPYGDEVIKALVKDQFLKDIYYPINILIQCLRFGKKKPTRLKIISSVSGDNVKYKYFDLNTFQYVETSGSLGSYEVEQTPSGCNYSAIGFVELSAKIIDQNFLKGNSIISPLVKLPVGLICRKKFKGTEEVQTVLVSFVDIIGNSHKDPSLTIEGLNVNGGVVSFTGTFPEEIMKLDSAAKLPLNDVLKVINDSNDGLFIPYINESVRDAYLEFSVFSKKMSTLALAEEFIQKYDLSKNFTFSCFNLEELKSKSASYGFPPANLLAITVGTNESRLLANVNDAYLKLQNENPYCTLKDLLDKYKEIMDLLEYHGSVFFEDEVQQSATQNPNGKVEESSVFSGQTAPSQPSQQPVQQQQQPVASQPSQPVQQTAPAQVDLFQEYLNKYLFDNKEFAREQIIPVTMTNEEVAKVNGVYEKLKNPFRVKQFGNFSDSQIIVGYLVATPDKKYYLLDPVQKEYVVNTSFHLAKFNSTMVRLLSIVVNQKPSPLKFTTKEAFDYYTMICERM